MIALYRYLMSSMVLSQRYLPPTLVFLAALSVGTGSDAGPLWQTYSFCVAAIVTCATWMTVALIDHEDAVQRQVITVAAGGARRVLAATIAAALTGDLLLITLGMTIPIAIGHHTVTAGALAAGTVAQLAAALVGNALGLLTSRPVIPRVGVALVVALAALLVMLLVRWASPINPLIHALSGSHSPHPVSLGLLAGVSVLLLAASAAVTLRITERRT
ncbi:hypothetical protein [Actinoallomurus sp. CA-150999]|uniref:hypothetical protein n=1 Tax=Actinoallomurus sp. CA-150999 TaxID=3239887 RepID=UPI003D8EED52